MQIDRVSAEVEILRKEEAGAPGVPSGEPVPGQPTSDPALRGRLRDVVMEILSEHLRGLERRGIL